MRHERTTKRLKLKENPFFSDDEEYRITAEDLKTDIMIMLERYYVGRLSDEGSSFIIRFDNGQKFNIRVDELH